MIVVDDLIPLKQGVRPGHKLKKCLGLVVHWIGVGQPQAEVIRANFGRDECGAHYVIDWNDGHIIRCVPEDEVCYHVGASRGFTYSDLKKRLVGGDNPNWYFVGIECCISARDKPPADYAATGKYMDMGKPSEAQYTALVEFAADFLTRHRLTAENGLFLHGHITNKACHVWFLKDAARWEKFKADVTAIMKGEIDMTQKELEALVDARVKAAVARELAERDAVAAKTAERVSSWAAESWQRAVDRGIFDGTRPGGSMTREQCAVVLDRLGEFE